MFKSIRFRLMLIAAVPLLFALVLTARSVKTAYDDYSKLNDLNILVKLASITSEHVHETQKERGMTGVFMASDGTLLAAELASQRAAADAKKADLTEFLATFDPAVFDSDFQKQLASAVKEMKMIDDYRTKVSNLSIPAKEALGFYTNHNAKMLNLVSNIAKLSDDAGLAKSATSYENLLQGKEQAGIERAVISKTLAMDRFEAGSLRKFATLVATQKSYFDKFRETANPEQAAFFDEKLSGSIIDEVQRIREVAFKKGEVQTDGFGIEASQWFEIMTQKINLMKEVGDSLGSQMRAFSENELGGLKDLLKLATDINALVHETQKERGLTAAYIGSDRTEFQAKLNEQYKLTDAASDVFDQSVSKLTNDNLHEKFISALAQADAKVNEIKTHRVKVSDDSISPDQAIGFYNEHNALMLKTISALSGETNNGRVRTNIIAYVNFLQGKERAGIERAVMSKAFTADRFEVGEMQKFISAVTEQNTYFNNFNEIATSEQIALYNEKLTGEVIDEVQRMRDVAIEKSTVDLGSFGVKANHWFNTITQKINLIKKVEDRIAGDLINQAASLYVSERTTLIILSVVALMVTLGVMALVFVVSRGIILPLNETVGFAEKIADGDLSGKLAINRKDEIGNLVTSLNTMSGNLQNMVRNLGANAKTLSNSSGDLSSTATEMSSNAEGMSSQSTTVASAAEEMSVNMSNMASSSEQMSASVKTSAAAVEEMTASISEIARNAEQASSVADQASKLAATSNEKISQLGTAADEIGKVIEVIQDIAEQTNLLALNATIEAARAGDAGKGFAVVATEVKELAKQTAEATEGISKRIVAIQGTSDESVESIGKISDVIKSVNDVSRTIASAVEEQSITTKEIAQNINQVASAAETVSRGVTESAAASGEITRNITGVDSAAKQTAQGATQTKTAGTELSKLSEELQMLVGQFKV